MIQVRRPVGIRIREDGGAWVIEQSGARFMAPFPLTDHIYGTPDYEAATDVQVFKFMELYVEQSPHLPEVLRETARRIAHETECVPQLMPLHGEP